MKKYLIIIALLAAFAMTGCTDKSEKPNNSGGSSETQSSSSSFSKKDENSKPESSVSTASDNSQPESKPNYDEVEFEPVVKTIGDIVEAGGNKYFELSTKYGNACTIVSRLIFADDYFSDCEMRIEPGTLTNIEDIIGSNRVGDAGAYEVSDYTKVDNTWVLTKEGWNDETNAFFDGAEINILYALLKIQCD